MRIGLDYTQPFLITRLTIYVGQKIPSKDDGYGLIGAFALVFILKGVCYLARSFDIYPDQLHIGHELPL